MLLAEYTIFNQHKEYGYILYNNIKSLYGKNQIKINIKRQYILVLCYDYYSMQFVKQYSKCVREKCTLSHTKKRAKKKVSDVLTFNPYLFIKP